LPLFSFPRAPRAPAIFKVSHFLCKSLFPHPFHFFSDFPSLRWHFLPVWLFLVESAFFLVRRGWCLPSPVEFGLVCFFAALFFSVFSAPIPPFFLPRMLSSFLSPCPQLALCYLFELPHPPVLLSRLWFQLPALACSSGKSWKISFSFFSRFLGIPLGRRCIFFLSCAKAS